jgi:hypothetical protein
MSIEATPNVRPAECKADAAAVGQLAVAGIAIDLQDALKPSRWVIGRSDLRSAA